MPDMAVCGHCSLWISVHVFFWSDINVMYENQNGKMFAVAQFFCQVCLELKCILQVNVSESDLL